MKYSISIISAMYLGVGVGVGIEVTKNISLPFLSSKLQVLLPIINLLYPVYVYIYVLAPDIHRTIS